MAPLSHPTSPFISVGLCESQPTTTEGVRALLQSSSDLRVVWAVESLPLASHLARQSLPNLLLLDKAAGLPPILDLLQELHRGSSPRIIVWGNAISEFEALRLLQSGVKGIVRKSIAPASLLECLRSVDAGSVWIEDCLLRDPTALHPRGTSPLTSRERQVLELVELGLNNREVAHQLGIQPGTVKIHLRHICEKAGVRGRHGLAASALRARIAPAAMAAEAAR